jgi:phospholipid N-methyltransferase
MTDFKYPGKDLEAMSITKNYYDWMFSKFDPFVGQNLLEIGAGRGNVTRFIHDRYKRPLLALEPSEMLDTLKHDLEGKIQDGQIVPVQGFLDGNLDLLMKSKIDTVFYINVLEHIRDDSDELKLVFDLLPANGHICTFSPAMPWLMSNFDRKIGHFRRYTLAELVSKMEAAGFVVEKACYMDSLGVAPWWLAYTIGGRDLGGGETYLYDNLVIPWLRYLEPSSLLPFGKNILVVGQKPR